MSQWCSICHDFPVTLQTPGAFGVSVCMHVVYHAGNLADEQWITANDPGIRLDFFNNDTCPSWHMMFRERRHFWLLNIADGRQWWKYHLLIHNGFIFINELFSISAHSFLCMILQKVVSLPNALEKSINNSIHLSGFLAMVTTSFNAIRLTTSAWISLVMVALTQSTGQSVKLANSHTRR